MNKFMNFAANVQTVFNNDVNDFMAFSQLLTDVALGKQEVSKEEANKKIVEVFQGVLGIDKNSRPADVRRALRRNQALVFDIIEETVQNLLVTGWGNDPFFQKYVDQRNLALGDKNEFYSEDDSILSVMKVAGNHHDIIRQRLGAGTVQSISTYWCAVKVYSEFERVVTGAEEFAKFVTKMYEAYDRYVKNALYDAMVGYATTLTGQFKKTGSVTAENLNALCDLVSTATGYPVMIMGTRTALSNVIGLQNAQYISDAMKDEHYRTGTLGMWEGKEFKFYRLRTE
jgi:6,7-dimethyl-8-ribityllumazine synthase